MSIYPEGPKRRPDGLGRAALAALLALGLHAAFAGVLLFLSLLHLNLPAGKAPPAPRAVTLRPLSSQQWAQNRGDLKPGAVRNDDRQAAARADAPKAEEKKKPEVMPEGQIVDVAPGNGQEDPTAKYLAESSNKVQKETRSKDQTAFYRNAMPRRTSTTPQDGSGTDAIDKPQVAGNNGLGNDDRPLREPGPKKAVFEVPDVKKRQEVAMRTDPASNGLGAPVSNQTESNEVRGNSTRLKIQPGDPGAGEEEASSGRAGQLGVVNLMPSMSVLDKVAGAAPNDHLGDVDEGQGTFLNTKEWKYASFFNRVKQSVGMHWDPGTPLRQRDPTGDIYGGRDRYTLVNVTLTDVGRVKDIYVEKSCGIDFLDLEAIRSFERAQPFPNPPPGLASADSTVRFSFGFFLEMGGGPRLRLFRQSN
jgi:TonB family protein